MKLFELLKRNTSIEEMPRWACQQGVGSLLYDEIVESGKNPFDRRGLMILSGSAQKQTQMWELQKEALKSMNNFCTRYALKMIVFKGYSMSLKYDVPEHRKPGDVDVYFVDLNENSFVGEKANELLRKHGVNVTYANDKHSVFDIKGSHFENHMHYLESEEHTRLKEVEEYLLKQPLQKSEEWSNIYYPSPNFYAIYLPLHTADHFVYEGTSLRLLVDWAVFLKYDGQNVNWKEIYSLADSIRFRKFLDSMNSIVIDKFDVPASCVGGDEYVRKNAKVDERVFKSFMVMNRIDANGSFLQVFYQKTVKQWNNRWKIKLVYDESFLYNYFSHSLRFVIRKIHKE